jgi:hypothetical protein
MRASFKDAVVISVERLVNQVTKRQTMRIDLGNSTAFHMNLYDPFVDRMQKGAIIEGSFELTGVNNWHLPKEDTGKEKDLYGVTVRGVLITSIITIDGYKVTPVHVKHDIREEDVVALNLPYAITKLLRGMTLRTVGDVVDHYGSLELIEGIGPKRLKKIDDALTLLGVNPEDPI